MLVKLKKPSSRPSQWDIKLRVSYEDRNGVEDNDEASVKLG